MKSQPKLKDTLEVFLDEMEKLNASISNIKYINPILENKIAALKQIRIEPETKHLVDIHRTYLTELNDKINRLDGLFQKNINSIQEINKDVKKDNSTIFIYGLVFFFLTALSIFFGVKATFNSSNLKKDNIQINSYNQSLENYIKESKQIEKYNDWLDSKNNVDKE